MIITIVKRSILLWMLFLMIGNVQIVRKQETKSVEIQWSILPIQKENTRDGTITIPKINLKEPLYRFGRKENTVDQNISFLKESSDPTVSVGVIVLAAHSGVGKIAYFKHLDQLVLNDSVEIEWKGIKTQYRVYKIIPSNKNGTIRIPVTSSKKILVLTTCKPNDKGRQLTIYAEKKNETVLNSQ